MEVKNKMVDLAGFGGLVLAVGRRGPVTQERGSPFFVETKGLRHAKSTGAGSTGSEQCGGIFSKGKSLE